MVSNANRGQKPCGETLLWAKGDHTVGSCTPHIGENVKVKLLVTQSCLTLCDPIDCSLPGSSILGFPGQEYWSGLPFPSPGNIPNATIKPGSPELQADSLLSKLPGKPTYGWIYHQIPVVNLPLSAAAILGRTF